MPNGTVCYTDTCKRIKKDLKGILSERKVYRFEGKL